MATTLERRLPVGAELLAHDTVDFRVWAPKRKTVEVVVESTAARHKLEPENGGYFSAAVHGLGVGTRYRFLVDGEGPFSDPATRFQPEGPHGPSEVVDPSGYQWTDHEWTGVGHTNVIYEMHIGTFTRAGTWQAAAAELRDLAALGVTIIEVMPVADFCGSFGWGYDGVNLFAPTRLYGRPDDFRDFVNYAHQHRLGVILDVVYNHVGPDGNVLKEFADEYFTDRYKCDWGHAINYDGRGSPAVREFFLAAAQYWITEFHLDGLRLDATQQIFDTTEPHIVAEVTRAVRQAALGRRTLIVAENETQDTRLLRPIEEGGYGIDAIWNDDFHHSARVALTDKREAYYSNHHGAPQEFISTAKYGYLYQGQYYPWQRNRRGTSTRGIAPTRFVNFLDNHDQAANSANGARIHELTSPGRYRAMTALWLLQPGMPMIFQGQEFASSAPFLYFADHRPDLARQVKRGRFDFLKQFSSIAQIDEAILADPGDRETFQRCKLDHSERETHVAVYRLHRDLLRMRRRLIFRESEVVDVDGAVLGTDALVLRYFHLAGDDCLLIVNLGADLALDAAPEPLLAPPLGAQWQVIWCSEDVRYGGNNAPGLETEHGWCLPAETAAVLAPKYIHKKNRAASNAARPE